MNALPSRVDLAQINAQIAAVRPLRPWHHDPEARRLIQSCAERPPVWEAHWLKPAHRETRDDHYAVSSDPRVVVLERIRQVAGQAIISQGQTAKAHREFDRWQRDTVEAVVTATRPCPVAAEVDRMHRIAKEG